MRPSLRRLAAMVVTVVATGVPGACMTSPAPRVFPRATSPYGEHVTLVMASGRSIAGELLAVTDTAWYLLVGDRVTAARPAAIASRTIDLGRRGTYVISFPAGEGPDAREVRAARDISRFPHGITAEVMAALLARSSQSAPDDVEKPPQ